MPSKPQRVVSRVFSTCHRIFVERGVRELAGACSGSLLIVGSGHDPHSGYFHGCSPITRCDIEAIDGAVDVVCDVVDLPFSDGAFDNVLASEVFEHVFDVDKAIAEVVRVLKPGGRLIITAPFMYHVHGDPFDFNRLTERAWRERLAPHMDVHIAPIGNRLTSILDLMGSAFRGAQIIRPINHLACAVNVSSSRAPSGYLIEGIRH